MLDFLWELIKDSVAVIKVVGSIVAIAIGIVFGIQQKKERMARKNGLAANPKRCQEQDDRLNSLEKKCVQYDADVAHLKETTDRIDANVGKLVDLHMKN